MPGRIARLVGLLLLLLVSWAEAAAPVFNSGAAATFLATTMFNLDISATAANNVVVYAFINIDSDKTVTSCTIGGGAATFQDAQVDGPPGFERTEVWYRKMGNIGIGNITVSGVISAATAILVTPVAYADNDQTTPFRTPVTKTNGASTTPAITVTSASDERVLSSIFVRDTTGESVTGGQTQRVTATRDLNKLHADDIAGAASVTPSYSETNSSGWAAIGLSLKPVAAPGTAVRHRAITN